MSRQNEKLIGIVKKHPILYDTTIPEFKNQFAKTKLWEEIGENLDMTGDECRSKWKNLRDTYSKHLKSLKCEGLAKSRYGKWQWATAMEFMKEHMGFISGELAVDIEADGNENLLPRPSPVQRKSPVPSSPKPRKQRAVEKVIWNLNEKANKLSSTEHIMLGHAKVIDGFSVQRRIETKMKIAQIVMQAELEEEEERNRLQATHNPACRGEEPTSDPLTESQEDVVFLKREIE